MRVAGFRVVDEDVWEEFKVYVLRKHGKLHSALAREVARALREYLERHAGAVSEAAPKGPRPSPGSQQNSRGAKPAKPAAAQAPEGEGVVGGGEGHGPLSQAAGAAQGLAEGGRRGEEILDALLREARRDCFQGVGRVNLTDLAKRLGCQPEQAIAALKGSGLEWRLDPSGRIVLIRL